MDSESEEKIATNFGAISKEKEDKEQDAMSIHTLIYSNKIREQNNYVGSTKSIGVKAQTIGELTIQTSPKEIQLEDILMTPDSKHYSENSWNKIRPHYTEDELHVCLNHLLEKQIVYMTSKNLEITQTLAYYISTKTSAKTNKKILFENVHEKQNLTLNVLIRELRNENDMVIIAEMNQYLSMGSQKIFFDSLAHQLHTDYLSELNNNKIFIFVLLTQKAAEEVCKVTENARYIKIWDFDETNNGKDQPVDDKNKSPEPDVFFDNLNHIQKILVYAGAFFNGLSFRSFDSVIHLLLSNQVNFLPIVIKQYRNFKKGAQLIDQIVEDAPINIWNSQKNWLFKSCNLKGYDEGGMLIVDFAYPDLKEKLEKYFKEHHHYFWQEQFNIIDKSNFIFSNDGRLAIKVIELMMNALSDDPNLYNEDWFWNQAKKIRDYENAESQIEEDSPEADFFKVIEFLTRQEDTNFFYNRFGQILNHMFINGWGEMVHKILYKIALKDQNVLLKLIQRLNDHKDFDKFKWIRSLLDYATSTEVKVNTYRWLANVIAPIDIKKTWIAVKNWLDEGIDLEDAQFSYYAARYFILDSFVKETFYFPADNYGKWPPLYSLFSNIIEDANKCREQIIYILHEFFNKDTVSQITGDNNRAVLIMTIDLLILENTWSEQAVQVVQTFLESRKDGYSYQTLLADIVEGWCNIITGFEQENNKEKEDLIDFILKTFLTEAANNSGYSGRIINRWEKKPGFYKELIAYLKLYSQEHTDTLSNTDQKALKKYGEVLYKRKNNLETFLQQLNVHLTTATL